MDKDGKNKEYLTEDGAFSYTLDDEMEKLYYSTSKYYKESQGKPRSICEVSLNTTERLELFNFTYSEYEEDPRFIYNYSGENPDFITYYDNCLYFDNYHFGGINNYSTACGMKYDIKNKKIYKLVGTQEIKQGYDEDGFPIRIECDPIFKWEEYSKIKETN